MSRGPQGDQITVKPTSNIYTILTVVAVVAVALAIAVVFKKATELFGGSGLLG